MDWSSVTAFSNLSQIPQTQSQFTLCNEMDWSSVTAFSNLSQIPQTQSRNHKFSPQNSFFSKEFNTATPLSINPTHLRLQKKSLSCFQSKFQQPRNPFQLSKLLPCFSTFSQSPFLQTPISKFPRIQCSTTTHKNFLKSTAGKVAIFLVGSFLFMGSMDCNPVVALSDAQKSTSSAPMLEKLDTQNGESNDEEMYVRLLEKNPKDVKTLKLVIYGKMRKGKTNEAVEYVERLIDIEPDAVEWRLLQAYSFEMMGYLSKAERLFKEILIERPLLPKALHGLAMVMHKNLEGPAVFEMLHEALELARREKRVTEERNIRILIAQMHVVKGDLEEGLTKFQDLVNDNPRDFRPYLCQGIIYGLLNKKKEAEEQLETYRNLVPHEFPERGFLDDVVLAAKTESPEQLRKEFKSEVSFRNVKTV